MMTTIGESLVGESVAELMARYKLEPEAFAKLVADGWTPPTFDAKERIEAIGALARMPGIGKHRATNNGHLKATIEALDKIGLHEYADTLVWLVWLETNAVVWRTWAQREALDAEIAFAEALRDFEKNYPLDVFPEITMQDEAEAARPASEVSDRIAATTSRKLLARLREKYGEKVRERREERIVRG